MKKGDWVCVEYQGQVIQGRIERAWLGNEHYPNERIKVGSRTYPVSAVQWSLGPMTRNSKSGVVKQNPKGRTMAKRKFSPAQLAAQKLFAQRARAGTLGKRKRNPLTRVKRNSPSMATGEAPSARLRKRRAKTAKAPAGYYANPLTRVKIGSKSMATGKAPSKRLKARRTKTAKAPRGYYANPVRATVSKPTRYAVHRATAGGVAGALLASFPTLAAAKNYGQAIADQHRVAVLIVGKK